MKKKVVIIDGQGGRLGRLIIEQMRSDGLECVIYAIGTNSIATAAMIKAGADYGATGENPVTVNCRDADIVAGPIGIVIADSLAGEVTPAMAAAVGSCRAQLVLLPVNRCGKYVIGVPEMSISDMITLTVKQIAGICG